MMGWLSVMTDTTSWTRQEHAAAREELQLYKSQLRPLIRDADLYHISERPDGIHWDGMEYFDSLTHRGVVYTFRGSTADENEHDFVLRGLNSTSRYRLQFHDNPAADRIAGGDDLMKSGLRVYLALPDSSDIVFLEETSSSRARTGNR